MARSTAAARWRYRRGAFGLIPFKGELPRAAPSRAGRDPDRGDGESFCATHTGCPSNTFLRTSRRFTGGGRGADYVIDSAGHEQAFRLSRDPAARRPAGLARQDHRRPRVAFRWGHLMGEKQIVRSSYARAPASRLPCGAPLSLLQAQARTDHARIRLE